MDVCTVFLGALYHPPRANLRYGRNPW